MKFLRQLVLLCAVIGMAGAGSSVAMAAEPVKAKEAPKDIVLKGDAKCTSCHDEADSPQLLAIGKTRHGVTADSRNPTCTSCHGESENHTNHKGSDKPPKPEITFGKNSKNEASARSEACLTCHQGGKRIHWQGGVHANRDVTCASCHQVHNKHDKVRAKETQTEVCFNCHKEQRNQVNKPSHHPIVEGKMTCTSCHDVHGDNPKMLARSTTNDTCFTCHMEKRGPFLHNHQPVSEDCSICHNPHGTTIPNLLKSRAPFLCQGCHNLNSGHPAQAASLPAGRQAGNASSTLGTVGRGCVNCHTNIHGSNSTQNSATAERFRR